LVVILSWQIRRLGSYTTRGWTWGWHGVDFRDFSWFVANLFLSSNFDPDGHRDDESSSSRSAIGALVLLMILVLVGLWIIDVLRQTDALQDCVLQGRTNCMPSLR
jgi:hypothetical protein